MASEDGQVLYKVRADDKGLEGDLKNSFGKVKSVGSKLTTLTGTMAKTMGASFLAVGTAIGGLGIASVSIANDMDKAMNGFIASTGKGTEEAKRYEGVLKSIYKNNYGDSFEDIGKSMATVTQQMGEMSDENLQKITESAYLMRDVFEMDINESIRGANSVMKQFGITGDDAYNLMAQGAQKGLNQNEDLGDQLAEYSVYYKNLGFTAEEMFDKMIAGAEGGVYQIDYMNDAIKEFGIRVLDGSDATTGAFNKLGLNADDMAQKFKNGGDDAQTAFVLMQETLGEVEDDVERNAIGVALFGTKWEDLGEEAMSAMFMAKESVDLTTDSLEAMGATKYDDLNAMFEGLKRTIELLLIPIGESMIPMLKQIIEELLPVIEQKLPTLIEMLGGVFDAIIPVIKKALPVLIKMFSDFIKEITPIINKSMPKMIALFKKLAPVIEKLLKKVLPVLIELVSELIPIFMDIIDLLIPIIDLIIDLLPPIMDLIKDGILPFIKELTKLTKTVLKVLIPAFKVMSKSLIRDIKNTVQGITEKIKAVTKIFNGLIKFITGVFKGDWKKAWSGIKDVFSGMWELISGIVKTQINSMIDLVNKFIRGINGIKLPDWAGGKGVSLPTIKRLKIGLDYVPSNDFQALLHEGEAVLTKEEARDWREQSGMYNNQTPQQSQQAPETGFMEMVRAFKKAFESVDFGGDSRDFVFQVGYEELARATNKGNKILSTRFEKRR